MFFLLQVASCQFQVSDYWLPVTRNQ